jgi:hypothetical protein
MIRLCRALDALEAVTTFSTKGFKGALTRAKT